MKLICPLNTPKLKPLRELVAKMKASEGAPAEGRELALGAPEWALQAQVDAAWEVPAVLVHLGTDEACIAALDEARARLAKQEAPPPPDERMIFLFGLVSPTEGAHGAASDDVFVKRAKQKGEVPITEGEPFRRERPWARRAHRERRR